MKYKGLYITLFVLTVALLAFPVVQQYGRWFKFKPLNGATVAVEQPQLSFKSFMSGAFQRQEDQYLAEHIGFREPMVRCYNQLSWSLFRKPQNKSIYVTKDNWIYNDFMIQHRDRQYVYEYGESNEAVVERMRASSIMLYQLQEVLKGYGVSLFVCMTPAKDLVCGEHLEQEHRSYDRPPGVLAIDFYPPIFDSLGINYLNLSDYFMRIKDTVSYPLYLKSSFHWSLEAACYTADTLVKYMESLSGINMHNPLYSAPYLAETRTPDGDLEELMNLLWPVESNTNYYVNVFVDNDSTAEKPKWLIVGDSYFWEWQYGLPLGQMFDTYHYWYYNNTIYNDLLHTNVSQVDLLRELLSTDVVMLIYSPSNLYDLNRDFLTKSLFALCFEDGTVNRMMEKIAQDIKNTPEWYASIEQKANASGQDVNQLVEDNARYMLMGTPAVYFDEFKEAKTLQSRNSRIATILEQLHDMKREDYRQQIYSNSQWLEAIKEKARQQGCTIEEAMEKDIDWLIKNEAL